MGMAPIVWVHPSHEVWLQCAALLKWCAPTQHPGGCPIVAVNLSTAVITLRVTIAKEQLLSLPDSPSPPFYSYHALIVAKSCDHEKLDIHIYINVAR